MKVKTIRTRDLGTLDEDNRGPEEPQEKVTEPKAGKYVLTGQWLEDAEEISAKFTKGDKITFITPHGARFYGVYIDVETNGDLSFMNYAKSPPYKDKYWVGDMISIEPGHITADEATPTPEGLTFDLTGTHDAGRVSAVDPLGTEEILSTVIRQLQATGIDALEEPESLPRQLDLPGSTAEKIQTIKSAVKPGDELVVILSGSLGGGKHAVKVFEIREEVIISAKRGGPGVPITMSIIDELTIVGRATPEEPAVVQPGVAATVAAGTNDTQLEIHRIQAEDQIEQTVAGYNTLHIFNLEGTPEEVAARIEAVAGATKNPWLWQKFGPDDNDDTIGKFVSVEPGKLVLANYMERKYDIDPSNIHGLKLVEWIEPETSAEVINEMPQSTIVNLEGSPEDVAARIDEVAEATDKLSCKVAGRDETFECEFIRVSGTRMVVIYQGEDNPSVIPVRALEKLEITKCTTPESSANISNGTRQTTREQASRERRHIPLRGSGKMKLAKLAQKVPDDAILELNGSGVRGRVLRFKGVDYEKKLVLLETARGKTANAHISTVSSVTILPRQDF